MRPSATEALQSAWIVETRLQHDTTISTSEQDRVKLHRAPLQSHLTKMACACMSSQLNLSQLHHLNQLFRHSDVSGDGRLSDEEMKLALGEVGVTEHMDVELIIESLDSDHSGYIEYSE